MIYGTKYEHTPALVALRIVHHFLKEFCKSLVCPPSLRKQLDLFAFPEDVNRPSNKMSLTPQS